ncbi:hypothetical protein [Catenulispora rubra]|uniref:hypothetical protein n=1 Tax=Catenulispora rubra TaxID=280293 RepID=UPI001892599A|nr:hypothetical protein [Catenulispora rubra]
MSRRTGRGSTGPGRGSPLPGDGFQVPVPVLPSVTGSLVVEFHGDDGRRRSFDFGELPMRGWRSMLAQAFALRTGYGGAVRTLTSAQSTMTMTKRFVCWLDGLDRPPATPADCRRVHINAFFARTEHAPVTRQRDLADLRELLRPVRSRMPEEVFDALCRRNIRQEAAGVGGFSDGEWNRLLAAARTDCAAVARRLRAGRELARVFREQPGLLGGVERLRGATLAATQDTGTVPGFSGSGFSTRKEMAGQLALCLDDLSPVMVLMTALTERNGETVKELPAQHRVLESRAVELTVIKRRRGAASWTETVTWEIGRPGRELHTPGGLYLLLHDLTEHARSVCGSPLLLCIWSQRNQLSSRGEYYAPFQDTLHPQQPRGLMSWALHRPRPLLADPVTADSHDEAPAPAEPLALTLNRVKTTADAHRTRSLGGHLPSSAKSNTAQVLFRHYLRPDLATREWADGVVQDALREAEHSVLMAHEQQALRAHQEAARARGGGARVIEADVARELLPLAQETAWGACRDAEHHPVTNTPCQDSLLDCLHCGNCLVTRDHLPALLALLDALSARYQRMDIDQWWRRYGPAWAALRRDILVKFDPAEVEAARTRLAPNADELLDLVENPWEHP